MEQNIRHRININEKQMRHIPKRCLDIELKVSIINWVQKTSFPDFYNAIEQRVIGQEALKLVVANVYNYLFNLASNAPIKNNMILAAPSGCGKTETYRAIKAYFEEAIPDLEVYIYDVSQLTSVGFKGLDASDVVKPFFRLSMEDAMGIVFLDEFDKKMTPTYTSDGINANKEVQSNLLTIIEGGMVYDKDGRHVNTEKLMFVALGSFDSFRESRNNKKNPIGLGMNDTWNKESENKDHYMPLKRDDMIELGASNEIIGRFSYIVNYEKLSNGSIDRIIDKTINNVVDTFNLENLIIDEPMFCTLRESANSKFGCRLIDSTIREIVLKAYSEAIFKQPKNSILSLHIHDADHVDVTWKKLKKREYEAYMPSIDTDDESEDDSDMIWE